MSRENDLKMEVIDSLKHSIAGCFGCDDGIFAGHQADENRAKEIRKFAAEKNITLAEMIQIAQEYMIKKGYIQGHINEQLPEIRKFFSKKLQGWIFR